MMSMAWEPVGSPDSHSVSDEELVVRFQANDVTAFDALIQRYTHPLHRYLVGLVGEDCVDDLIQETFIRAHRNLPPMQELRSFKAWLYRIATNLARDHRRHTILIRWLPWKEHKELSADGCLFVEGPEQAVEEAEFI